MASNFVYITLHNAIKNMSTVAYRPEVVLTASATIS